MRKPQMIYRMKAEGNNIIAQSLYVLMFSTVHLPPRDKNTFFTLKTKSADHLFQNFYMYTAYLKLPTYLLMVINWTARREGQRK